KNAKIPINFKQHDQLIPLPLTTPNQHILIPTPHPSLITFSQSTLPPLPPTPPPLKPISLPQPHTLVALDLPHSESQDQVLVL
ncbi:hypothetical protein, partial [Staphylococcus epidermidis]|uniref:hypothetical protein n=1 Tax=Staphylococcus epidermidis TaxID=1282 RepID=UPI001C930E2C